MGEAPRKGVAEIVYYVKRFDETGFALHRSDTLYPYDENSEPKPIDPILCAPLQSLKLTYFDSEGDAHSQWDSESEDMAFATPRAVEIVIALGPDKSVADVFQTRVQNRIASEIRACLPAPNPGSRCRWLYRASAKSRTRSEFVAKGSGAQWR